MTMLHLRAPQGSIRSRDESLLDVDFDVDGDVDLDVPL